MSAHKRLEHQKKHEKKAKGGKINEYNAQGSPEVKEAKDQKEGFKHGGMKKKKHGGHADGKAPHHRLDKHKRGGKTKMAAGGSPFTAAAKRTPYSNTGDGEGHMNIGKKMDSQGDVEGHNKNA